MQRTKIQCMSMHFIVSIHVVPMSLRKILGFHMFSRTNCYHFKYSVSFGYSIFSVLSFIWENLKADYFVPCRNGENIEFFLMNFTLFLVIPFFHHAVDIEERSWRSGTESSKMSPMDIECGMAGDELLTIENYVWLQKISNIPPDIIIASFNCSGFAFFLLFTALWCISF